MPPPEPDIPAPEPSAGSPPVGGVPDDDPARSAAERLFDELRDECNEIGVTARGFNAHGFEAGVRAYGREARRLGATAERTIIMLKECLRDPRLRDRDRTRYDVLRDMAVRWAIEAYFDTGP